jgi:hypothetical protein
MNPFSDAFDEVVGYLIRSIALLVIAGLAFGACCSLKRSKRSYVQFVLGFLAVGWFLSIPTKEPDLYEMGFDKRLIQMGINKIDWDMLEEDKRAQLMQPFLAYYEQRTQYEFWLFYVLAGGLGMYCGFKYPATLRETPSAEPKGFMEEIGD